jgi:hypothetical protein
VVGTTFDGKSPMSDLRQSHGRKEPWKLKYFGVGNENWGCGGRMTAEYYADEYRRYGLYARNYGDNKLFRIACGPRNDDYHWTRVLMKKAGQESLLGGRYMDGLALHYYTSVKRLPDGSRVGAATQFDEAEWIEIISKGLFMDELVRRHSTIMDEYDPAKKVALIVDEWGTWYAVEPGTHPRFLYQQNTMRDAIVAATTFDIFNKYCDRVRMANIAQTVNVLQAMILTQNEKMLLTPSYHVSRCTGAPRRHEVALTCRAALRAPATCARGVGVGLSRRERKLHITRATPIRTKTSLQSVRAWHEGEPDAGSCPARRGDERAQHLEQPNAVTEAFSGAQVLRAAGNRGAEDVSVVGLRRRRQLQNHNEPSLDCTRSSRLGDPRRAGQLGGVAPRRPGGGGSL